MAVDGVQHNPPDPDPSTKRQNQRIDSKDPRFQQGGREQPAPRSMEGPETPAPNVVSDRLKFKGPEPENPFDVLVKHWQRRRRRRKDEPEA